MHDRLIIGVVAIASVNGTASSRFKADSTGGILIGPLCWLRYDDPMPTATRRSSRLAPLWRAIIEIAFIVFLFYSNLLMGEYNASNGHGKALLVALNDIFTAANFLIAMVSALVGYVVFEFLRKKL